MAKLKLKYGRLDSLPPMLSPRTMFASTHILHTLKKGESSEEGKDKRNRYAAYIANLFWAIHENNSYKGSCPIYPICANVIKKACF